MTEASSTPLKDFTKYTDEQILSNSQSFYEQVKKRHSVRAFSEKPVPKHVIENAILSAGTAPSGANHQPWHFVAISSLEVKRQIRLKAEEHERKFYSKNTSQEWLDALKPLGTNSHKPYLEIAPWLIAIFSQKNGGIEEKLPKQNYYVHESVGIATGMLITALHFSGLATLTHTPKPMTFLSEICKRPDNERPYMLLVVGHPSDDAEIPLHALRKKPLSQISTFK